MAGSDNRRRRSCGHGRPFRYLADGHDDVSRVWRCGDRGHVMFDARRLLLDLFGLCLVAAAVFMVVSLVTFDPADPPSTMAYPPNETIRNACGAAGATFAYAAKWLLGIGSYVLAAAVLATATRILVRGVFDQPVLRMVGWMMIVAAACVGVQLFDPGLGGGQVIGSGGYIGVTLRTLADRHLATPGTLILIGTCFLAGSLLAVDAVFFQLLGVLVTWPLKLLPRREAAAARVPSTPLVAAAPSPLP
ncbi:MAG: hypothetical protein D6725_16460, partial [Planctomycetota bacterium]